MKQCTKCSKNKQLSEYFVKDKQTGRLHAHCKSCYTLHRQSYSKEHYQKYGEVYRERAKIRRTIIKKNLQMNMLKYLIDKSCVLCGEQDIRTFEFDHLDPQQKSFGIAKGITDGRKWEVILEEITKCRILCANCHKKHTAFQNNWYKIAAK